MSTRVGSVYSIGTKREREGSIHSVGTKTPRRERIRATCCGCISLRHAILVLSIVGFIGSLTITILYGMRITDHIAGMTLAEIAVTGSEVAMWLWMVFIMMVGIYGVWKENSKFVEAFFWFLILHWFADLGVMIAFLVVMFQIKSPIVKAQCAKISSNCGTEITLALLLVTIILILYKLFSMYICYIIFCYRSILYINNEEDEDEKPQLLRFLNRSNSNASDAPLRKIWTPSGIPTIHIDFASDQSSASTYSNDSPSYRDTVYGYPKVASPPAVVYANHPAGSAINYNPGFRYEYEYNYVRPEPSLNQPQPQLHPQPTHEDAPPPPSFSVVVGSNKGAST